MSVSTTSTTIAGLTPARWRVLNWLFYAGTDGFNLATLVKGQVAEWDDLAGLEQSGLVVAAIGSVPITVADLDGAKGLARASTARVRLTPAGHRKVTTNPDNQVICMLGGRPNRAARVRDLKAEGQADDDLLFRMSAAGLIAGSETGGTPLEVFRRLPADYLVRLTTKGWQYYPRGL